MSMPEERVRRADLEADPAAGQRENGAVIDADVEADVNAAVPDDDERDEETEAPEDAGPH
jgi:hypothetical protein